jgi:aspartate dehydrogenase
MGEQVLASGRRLCTLSIGALADQVFADRLAAASVRGGGRLVLPTGALGGFDALMTLRQSGLAAVEYISTKPPSAWKATPAEEMIDLANLHEPTTFFRGTAREAARLFPKNANLAAAVALAGLGFEKTQVDLVANPAARTNFARVNAWTQSAVLSISLESAAFDSNPKSSSVVGASVIAALANAAADVSFA